MKDNLVLVAIVALLGVSIAGAYFFPLSSGFTAGTSPTGSTFSTAKVAEIVWGSILSGSATSTSILNTDANDRIITDSFAFCSGTGTSQTAYTGTGLAALLFRAATTSTSAPAIVSNTNYAANMTIGTSTPNSYNATSTEGVLAGTSRVWPAGSYLTFFSNATNTAACIVGSHYLAS